MINWPKKPWGDEVNTRAKKDEWKKENPVEWEEYKEANKEAR